MCVSLCVSVCVFVFKCVCMCVCLPLFKCAQDRPQLYLSHGAAMIDGAIAAQGKQIRQHFLPGSVHRPGAATEGHGRTAPHHLTPPP